MGDFSQFDLTCYFIVSPALIPSSLLEAIKRHLEDRGVSCLVPDGRFGRAPISETTLARIRSSDFVCAILTRDQSAGLMLELGMALGMAKHILLFVDEHSNLPLDVAWIRAMQIDQVTRGGLPEFIETFLVTLPPAMVNRSLARKGNWARREREFKEFREEVASLQGDSPRAGLDFERLVIKLLRQFKFSVTESPRPDYGADFAMWSPSLKKTLGLPVLVELKTTLRAPQAQAAVDRMADLIRNKRGGVGLIVTLNRFEGKEAVRSEEPVAIVSLDQLLRSLETGEFLEEMLLAIETSLKGSE